jgi:hypothetical protein
MDLARFLPLMPALIPKEVYGRDDTIFQELQPGTCLWTCPIVYGSKLRGVVYLAITDTSWRIYVGGIESQATPIADGVVSGAWMADVQRQLRTVLVPKPTPPVMAPNPESKVTL